MIAWYVTAFNVLPGRRLDAQFADRRRGVQDMSDNDFRGVFEPLEDEAYFAKAEIKDGVVVSPNGVDIAPDATSELRRELHPSLTRIFCTKRWLRSDLRVSRLQSGSVPRTADTLQRDTRV